MKTVRISSLDQIQAAAREFVSAMGSGRVFSFAGKMGAGKTTFIKAVCRELGVTETVNSPTFSIVNEYATLHGETVYHFDFYRINSVYEAKDIGVEDYFYSGNICFLEWAENIPAILPDSVINISIKEIDNGERIVEFSDSL